MCSGTRPRNYSRLNSVFLNVRPITLLFCFCGFLLLACGKKPRSIQPEITAIGPQAPVRFISLISDGWVIGGGAKDSPGFVAYSENLSHFEVQEDVWDRPLYSAGALRDRIYFGADSGVMIFTENLTDYFKHWPDEQYWFDDHKKTPVRSIQRNGTSLIALAGGGLSHGLLLSSVANEYQFAPQTFDNELRGLASPDPDNFWAVGNGIVLQSKNAGTSWVRQDLPSEFFTDLAFDTESHGFMCTFQGGFYETTDGGSSWEKIVKSDRDFDARVSLLHLTHDKKGNWVAVGPSGSVAIKIAESDWEVIDLGTSEDFFSVAAVETGKFAIGGEGRLFTISL